MPFSLNSGPFSNQVVGDFPRSCSCRTHLSHQRSAPFFQQVTKVEQRRRIERPFAPKIEPAELPEHGHVVEGVFAGFGAQIEPVGYALHPQHPLRAHRRSPVPGFRVMRLDHRTELGPRHQAVHPRQKLRLASRPALLLESLHCRQRHLLYRLVRHSSHRKAEYI
jgi:hypothetical protein